MLARLSRLLLALLLLAALGPQARAGTLTVEMLDVGQGDSILITSPGGKHVLIDAGVKEADVVGQLRQRGIAGLNLVVATHPHADHIGGMANVVSALPIKLYTDNGLPHTTATYVTLMQLVESKGITYRPALRGQSYSLDDGIKLEVLFPDGRPLSDTRSDLNSNSVVLRLIHGDSCFLFVGDSEDPTEQALLQDGMEPCDVLKVAHHGSNHSTSAAWLRAVKPSIALISVGVGNRYGHPGEETMARLASADVQVYRTDLLGTLVVEDDGKHITVRGMGKESGEAPALSTLPGHGRAMPQGGIHPRGPAIGPSDRPADDRAAEDNSTDGDADASAAVPPPRSAGHDATDPAAESAPSAPTPPRSALAAQAAAQAGAQPGDADCMFVSSRNSSLYHPWDCGVVARIYPLNRQCWTSEAQAQAAGKSRSQSCKTGD